MTINWPLRRRLEPMWTQSQEHRMWYSRIADMTGGRGADAFEVVGATPTIQSAIQSVKRGGHVTLVGNLPQRSKCPSARSPPARSRCMVAAHPTANILNASS
ncbi:MAG: zinc-binding dehydrogenase [Pirellulales bacterium]